VLIAIVLVAATITLIDMPYPKYFEGGAQFVHFLLGTATVSLAVRSTRAGCAARTDRAFARRAAAGGVTSIAERVGIARLLGADAAIVGGFVAKSVTAPIAMGIAERIGVSPTHRRLRRIDRHPRRRSRAIRARCRAQPRCGSAVSRSGRRSRPGHLEAFSVNAEAGAYASLAMGLHGVLGRC